VVIARRPRTPARTKIFALGLATAGLIMTGMSWARVAGPHRTGTACRTPATANLGRGRITWLGDTFLGDAGQKELDEYGYQWVSEHLPPFATDLVVANLEGPITLRTEAADPLQQFEYNANPLAAPALAALGINVVNLANNHGMDRGPEGLADTMAHTKAAGMRPIGAGADLAGALEPLIVNTDSGRIALVALADVKESMTAAVDHAGVAELTQSNLTAAAQRARALCADRIVALAHWGENYQPIDARQRAWAKRFSAAGYDLVIGTGPHLRQPIEVVDGMPVVFSIGNFIFTTPGRYEPDRAGYSIILTSDFGPKGRLTLTAQCLLTDNERVQFQPRACDDDEGTEVLENLNPAMTVSDGVGTLTVVDGKVDEPDELDEPDNAPTSAGANSRLGN
jgi:Bacterial capsule synthesis protein PGA_cap